MWVKCHGGKLPVRREVGVGEICQDCVKFVNFVKRDFADLLMSDCLK